MNTNKKFDNILSECLDRILAGETIEQCLQKYPEQAAELEPLLKTALDARRTSASIQPRIEFRTRARHEFQAALKEVSPAKKRGWLAGWRWQSAWAVAISILVILVISAGGTMVAARNSMPDSALYSVKLATERVQLAFSTSPLEKAALNASIANKRVEEVIYLANRGESEKVQAASQRLNSNLVAVANLAGNESNAATTFNEFYSKDHLDTQSTTAGNSESATSPVTPPNPETTVVPTTTVAAVTSIPDSDNKGLTTRQPAAGIQGPVDTRYFDAESGNYFNSQSELEAYQAENSLTMRHMFGLESGNGSESEFVQRNELMEKLVQQSIQNLALLNKTYDKAPPWLQPILLQVIEEANQAYYQAILNLKMANSQGGN